MKFQMVLSSLALSALLVAVAVAQSRDSSNRSDRSSRREASSQSDQSRSSENASNEDEERDNSSENSSRHAGLGVTLSEDNDGNVSVAYVVPGSPAHRAGLRSGDELLRIDGEEINSAQDAVNEIRERDPGDRVALEIRRDGRRQELQARLVGRQTAFHGARNRAWSEDSGQNRMAGNWSNQSAQIQSLQQQVSQLRQEVQQLREEQGQQSYQTGYRGQNSRDDRSYRGYQRQSNRQGQDRNRDRASMRNSSSNEDEENEESN